MIARRPVRNWNYKYRASSDARPIFFIQQKKTICHALYKPYSSPYGFDDSAAIGDSDSDSISCPAISKSVMHIPVA